MLSHILNFKMSNFPLTIPPSLPLSLPPKDCLFQILPMHRYSAQEQFQKATQTSKSMPDVVILQKLQTAAEQEKKQSLIEIDKQWGTRVQYGTTMVQVGESPFVSAS